MKVSELITILQSMPQDATVHLTSDGHIRWNNECRDVINNKDGTIELDNWPPVESEAFNKAFRAGME